MPVKPISRSTFVRALRRRFPRRIDGYFAYDISHPRHIIVTTDAPDSVLYARFSEFCSSIPFHGTFVLFPEAAVKTPARRSGFAGWRNAREWKYGPLAAKTVDEVISLIQRRSYFRRRTMFENYFVCDASMEWFALFCHDEDVHFWMTDGLHKRARVRSWRKQPFLQEMPRWPHVKL